MEEVEGGLKKKHAPLSMQCFSAAEIVQERSSCLACSLLYRGDRSVHTKTRETQPNQLSLITTESWGTVD